MTMNEFKPDKVLDVKVGNSSIKINQRIIPDSAVATKYVASYVPKGGKMKPCAKLNNGTGIPKGIVVHNTDWVKTSNPDLAKQYAFATWPNCNMGGVMVHYYVHKTNIWQLLDNTERGWHATDGSTRRVSNRPNEKIGGNLDCIAIECIAETSAGSVKVGEETTAMLCAHLCIEYKLDPKLDIYPHQYFHPNKRCPAFILDHWNQFIDRVQYFYDETKKVMAPPVTNPDAPTNTATTTEPLKYEVGYILGIKKGAHPSNTPDDINPETTIEKYGTCKEVVPGKRYPYKIGAHYYAESDCVLYTKKIAKGTKLTLKNVPMYSSASTNTSKKTISGTYYVYDGIIFADGASGKIRICPATKNVGATPVAANVTGYIKTTDIE